MKEDRDDTSVDSLTTRDDEIVHLLGKIHDQLDRAHRRDQQQDFSVLRLFGALLQMFAMVLAFWGLAALLDEASGTATARFTLACFLQLASFSMFVIDRFR